MKGRKLAVATRRQNWGIRLYFAHTVHFSCDLWHFRHEIQARPRGVGRMAAIPEREYPGSNVDASRKYRARIRPEADNVDFSSTGPRLLARAPPAPVARPGMQALATRARVLCAIDDRFGNVILDRDPPGGGMPSLGTRVTGHTSAASDTLVPMPFCGNDPG